MKYQEIEKLVATLEKSDFEFPTRLTEDKPLFLSKVNSMFCLSYTDLRCEGGIKKRFNLTSSEVLRLIKNKI